MKRVSTRRAAAKVAAANTYELELAAMRERCASAATAANEATAKAFAAIRERDKALEQCDSLRAALHKEREAFYIERERHARTLESAHQTTLAIAENAHPTPKPPPPVNEHADAHETIAQLGELLTNLAEARARALRAAPRERRGNGLAIDHGSRAPRDARRRARSSR